MSKNISKLSGRIGLKNNLFQKMSDSSLSSKNGEGITEKKETINKEMDMNLMMNSFKESRRYANTTSLNG